MDDSSPNTSKRVTRSSARKGMDSSQKNNKDSNNSNAKVVCKRARSKPTEDQKPPSETTSFSSANLNQPHGNKNKHDTPETPSDNNVVASKRLRLSKPRKNPAKPKLESAAASCFPSEREENNSNSSLPVSMEMSKCRGHSSKLGITLEFDDTTKEVGNFKKKAEYQKYDSSGKQKCNKLANPEENKRISKRKGNKSAVEVAPNTKCRERVAEIAMLHEDWLILQAKISAGLMHRNCKSVAKGRAHVLASFVSKLKCFLPLSPDSACAYFGDGNRITSLSWNQNSVNTFAIGTKNGSISLGTVKNENLKLDLVKDPAGAGTSVSSLKFHRNYPESVFATTLEGYFVEYSINSMTEKDPILISETENPQSNWYISLDISNIDGTMAIGDCRGNVRFFDSNCQNISTLKASNRDKIAYLEFNAQDPMFIVTASNDKTVKIWDRRMLDKCLISHSGERPFNSATFSKTDGGRLLVTSMGENIQVLKAPLWDLERSFRHPHRFFQYLTPIRASWHPHEDIFCIGRFPALGDKEDVRSVDFYSANTGEMLTGLLEHINKPGIKSLNEFNRHGDILLSSSGQRIVMWSKSKLSYDGITEL